MSHLYAKYLVIPAILFSAVSPAAAQLSGYTTNSSRANNENSPYSRYGLGEQRQGVNMLLRGMGGISAAYNNPFAVNTDNPASYASLRLTTYEAGGEGSIRNTSTSTDHYTTGMATVSYLNVGIPVSKNGGLAFGLRPAYRTRYSMFDTVAIDGLGNVRQSYLGDGSVNYGYLGGAYKFKGLSLGFNFGYMFGTIETSNSISGDSAYLYSTAIQRSNRVGGVYWSAGAQYETKLNKKLSLRLGAVATLKQELGIKHSEDWLSYSVNSTGTIVINDTLYSVTNQRSQVVLPASYRFGAHLYNSNKWMAGVDITTTQWNQFRKLGERDSVANNTIKIAVGGEYTPDAADTRNYFQRVTYRLGFYYGTDYVFLRNTNLNYYAVTAGMSLPFKRTTDRIHLALEIGNRGTTANGLLKETFMRFGVGITLNDKWFIKRKYD